MKTDSLQDLFIDELGDLYSAGSQVLKVLPKMAEAAIAPELRQLFQSQIIQALRKSSASKRSLRRSASKRLASGVAAWKVWLKKPKR